MAIIDIIVFINLNSIRLRLFSIEIFKIEDVVDIKNCPTIRANVPIYLGRKYMLTIRRAEEIA